MKRKEIALLLVILAVDLITKWYFSTNLELYESITIIDGFLYFTYAQNTGAAWSILEGSMTFFYIVSVVGIIAIIYFFKNTKENQTLSRVSLVLMFAGLLGNFYDRLVFQYVRDFIDVIIFGYDFPIFNIADSVLCIGVALLALDVYRNPSEV